METFILILNVIIITILLLSFIINNLITRNIQSIAEDLFHKVNKMQDKQKVIESSVSSLGELFIITEKQKDEVSKNINDMSETIYQLLVANKSVFGALREHNETMAITLADNNKEIQELISSINNSNKDATSVMKDIGEQVESLDETLSIRRKPSKKVDRPSISKKADKFLNMTIQQFIHSGEVHQFLSLDKHNINVINRFLNLIYTYSKDIKDEKIINMNGKKLTEVKGAGKVMSDIFEEMKKEIINLK
jgi:hypothetical protein